MVDKRIEKLAEIFIDHSLKVKKGDKVVISTSDLEPIEIIRETYRLAIQRGAIVYLDVMGWNYFLDRASAGDLGRVFLENATPEQIKNPPEIYKDIIEWGDKFVRITSFDNYSYMSGIDAKKIQMKNKSYHEWFRIMIDYKPWVMTYYPTQAYAQKAGMSLSEMQDFYFDCTLVDYDKMLENGKKVTKLLDKAKKVRIVGEKTDLTIDIEGRLGRNSYGMMNIPDGEVYYAPVHTKTEGHIYYDLPFSKTGGDIVGAYLEFKDGKVVKASAEQGEEVLMMGLDSDNGARYLGELGIGLNPKIQRVMRDTLFDEKIGGTVHVTLGEAYTFERGGWPGEDRNESSIHWDLVKDMRKKGSYIEVDGVVKFKNGKWLV